MSKGEADTSAKKKSKLPIIIIAAVLLMGGAGGGAWFFAKKGTPDPAAAADAERKAALRSRVFLPLDVFTVNLADTREPRMAQIGITLEVATAALSDDIKAVMPVVRSRVLTIVSSKQARELLTVEGKEQLAHQIADEITTLLGYQPTPRVGANGAPVAAAGQVIVASLGGVAQPPSQSGKPMIEVNFSQFIVQ